MSIYSRFYEKLTKIYIKNLRHGSLDSNVGNLYAKFYVWDMHNKRDMYIQKKNSCSDLFFIISITLLPIFSTCRFL